MGQLVDDLVEKSEPRDRMRALEELTRLEASLARVDFEDELPPADDLEALDAAEREHGISYLGDRLASGGVAGVGSRDVRAAGGGEGGCGRPSRGA